jgi:hypothetical protein
MSNTCECLGPAILNYSSFSFWSNEHFNVHAVVPKFSALFNIQTLPTFFLGTVSFKLSPILTYFSRSTRPSSLSSVHQYTCFFVQHPNCLMAATQHACAASLHLTSWSLSCYLPCLSIDTHSFLFSTPIASWQQFMYALLLSNLLLVPFLNFFLVFSVVTSSL